VQKKISGLPFPLLSWQALRITGLDSSVFKKSFGRKQFLLRVANAFVSQVGKHTNDVYSANCKQQHFFVSLKKLAGFEPRS
jgi:hypothetical protein